jgi:hypothetical protein
VRPELFIFSQQLGYKFREQAVIDVGHLIDLLPSSILLKEIQDDMIAATSARILESVQLN